jgi:hypothetical protein
VSDYDSPWKEVLDRYFEMFMLFFFPHAHADIDWSRSYETLDKELQKIAPAAEQGRRFVDKLVKVWLKNGEERWLLIHVEVQTGREADFARRMYVYNNRIFARYDHEVISLAILADDDPDWRPSQYGYERWGFRAGMEFPIIKLLDYAPHWQRLETHENPFAIVVLTHLKALETREHPIDRQAWKLRLAKGLYERGLSADDVRQLFLFIDWVMDLPPVLGELFWEEMNRYQEEKRMPFVSSIEKIGMRKGLQEGIEKCLQLRFGAEGLKLLPEIKQILDVDVLRAILDAITTANTAEELRRIWAP